MADTGPIAFAAALAVGIGIMPVGAAAQEPWPFVAFAAFRYDSLVNTNEITGLPCCAPHVVAIPGRALIHLSAVIDVPWSEELDRVSVSARDLTLTVAGEEPLAPIGEYDRLGLFEVGAGSLSASRPRDFPDADEHLYMEAVWSLPEGATAATLTLGELFSTEIEIPQAASAPVTAGDTASFAITAITRVDQLESVQTESQQAVTGIIAPAAGQIVKVDFTLTPLADTSLSARPGFLLYTRTLQLVGPSGLPTIPLGEYIVDKVVTNGTNSFSGEFVGATYDDTFYFLTDGAPGTYTLYFMADPVAEATLE